MSRHAAGPGLLRRLAEPEHAPGSSCSVRSSSASGHSALSPNPTSASHGPVPSSVSTRSAMWSYGMPRRPPSPKTLAWSRVTRKPSAQQRPERAVQFVAEAASTAGHLGHERPFLQHDVLAQMNRKVLEGNGEQMPVLQVAQRIDVGPHRTVRADPGEIGIDGGDGDAVVAVVGSRDGGAGRRGCLRGHGPSLRLPPHRGPQIPRTGPRTPGRGPLPEAWHGDRGLAWRA